MQLCLLSLCVLLVGCSDIATLNCPDDFDMVGANVSTGIGRSDLAQFFYSPFLSADVNTNVQNIIIQSDQQGLDSYVYGSLIWPYVVIAILFTITLLVLICCTVFEKSCPPCQSWRRNFSKRPYEKFQIRCVAVFSILFGVGILSTSIAAFTIVPAMETQIKYTKCGLYTSLDVALNGDSSTWGGYSHIKNQVGNISELLNNASSKVSNYFTDDDALSNAMLSMKQENNNIYVRNQDANVSSPNPSGTLPNVKSYFIENYLGPSTASDTMTYDINQALTITQQLSSQADSIINSGYIIVSSASTIQANTNASQVLLSLYEEHLNTFKTELDSFTINYFDSITNWGIYVIEIVIGLVLVGSLGILLGTVSVQCLDIVDCRHFITFGWVVYGFMYFGVVLTTFFMLSMGSMGYTFCSYYEGFLNNQTEFNKINDYYSQNVLTKLDRCLYGDGNVLVTFDAEDEMNTVANLFASITTFNDYDDSTSNNYIDQSASADTITTWNDTLNQYRLGIVKDVDPLITSDDNAVRALSKMNEYTNEYAGASFSHCSKDRWVFDAADCTNASQFTYTAPVTESEGTTIDTSFVSCISLNEKLYQSSPSNWTERDIMKRYVQIKQDCSTAYTGIQNYAKSITEYRDSRENLFQSLSNQLTNLHTTHATFNADLDSFRTSLSQFSSEEVITSLNNLVTNQNSGLLISSDCRPVGDNMRFFYNSFCHNFMGMAVQLGFCTIVLLFLLIGGLFTGCVHAQRISTMKRLHAIHEVLKLPEESIHSENFARKEKSEDDDSSSSSSEAD